jgi:hypothetical protein
MANGQSWFALYNRLNFLESENFRKKGSCYGGRAGKGTTTPESGRHSEAPRPQAGASRKGSSLSYCAPDPAYTAGLAGRPPCDGCNLLDPKEVLANEAFPRDSPRPDFLGTLDRPSPLFVPGWFKKLGVGKKGFPVDKDG